MTNPSASAGETADTVSVWRHALAILSLPFMNAIAIPALIVALTGGFPPAAPFPGWLGKAVGLLLLAAGLALATRSIRLFVTAGRGTLAPWDPARVLMTGDVYRYTRNPLKTGLFLILVAWCLLFQSWGLTIWAAFFIVANVHYIQRFEEPALARRFGADYAAYCARVPRWLGVRRVRPEARPVGSRS